MKRLDPLGVTLEGTHLIEASAGTGKTFTIALLALRFVVERALPIAKILVVTYTIAATAELRGRIRRRLREARLALRGESAGEDAALERLLAKWREGGLATAAEQRLDEALREFDEAPIFTIHGFCQRVLQENAFESGVPFDARLVPGEGPMLDEIAADLFARVLSERPEPEARDLAGKLDLKTVRLVVELSLTRRRARFLPEAPADDRTRVLRWIADQARHEAAARKEASNTQSFDDLLHRLADALAEDEGKGGRLAARVRDKFAAAMIDEFQDTDPVQLDIFRRSLAGHTPLYLIGDPKQSIYSFRGADLHAYLDARRALAPVEHTLGSNWRSDKGLVAAVNALFGARSDPFLVKGIEFSPVEGEIRSPAKGFREPLRFVFIEREGRQGKGGQLTRDWLDEPLARAVAAEVAGILDSGATIAGRRVEPGDIAILARFNWRLQQICAALRDLRIPVVIQGATNVFDDREAEEMERVASALADPADPRAVRAALATSLLGATANEIFALADDEVRWDAWAERFRRWHDSWRRRGFAAAFREVLAETGAAERLAAAKGGERSLTNFLHLAELLQGEEASSRRGPIALVEWLRDLRDPQSSARTELHEDATRVRLESDARAVKLLTLHGAKGLQWPIVLCPDLWQSMKSRPGDQTFPRFHRRTAEGDALFVQLDPAEKRSALVELDRECVEEGIRLLYVAVTRARHHCRVWWGNAWGGEHSPLASLLHPAEFASQARFKKLGDGEMMVRLEELAQASKKTIRVERVVEQRVLPFAGRGTDRGALEPRVLDRVIRDDWRTSSFTGLVRFGHTLSRLDEEGIDRDQGSGEAAPAASAIGLAEFPAGPNAGNALHAILESIDFAADRAAIEAEALRVMPRFGLADEWAPRLAESIAGMLATPLVAGERSFALRAVARARRRSEMKFFLPVGRLDPQGLAHAFAEHRAPTADPSYAARIGALGFQSFAGFLQGAIDLVFEHERRWYVIDWKSNHLGAGAADYAPGRLAAEMAHHDYFLQSHLYAVAVDRHLRLRLADYDYERDFGGVLYLFVRGIAPAHPAGAGVFFDRPPRALVAEISAALGGGRRAA